MKKLLKVLAWIIGIVIFVISSIALYIQIKGIPYYETQQIDIVINATPQKLARGKKLASMLCANCHMNRETRILSGQLMLDSPKEFGPCYAPNITGDKEFGIGDWTDGEILYLLRTGIKRDGQYAPPWMAKLPKMSDSDIESIIAFLRSDDNMVNAASVPDQPCEPTFLAKFLTQVAFFPFEFPLSPISEPDTNNPVEWGKYLIFNLECFSCHSADFKTNDYLNPEKSVGYLGGGNLPLDLNGNPMPTQNITPDKVTGIGNMTEDGFVKLLKFGIKENSPAMRFPMLPYSLLTDNEAKAIFAYLQTVDPISNDVDRAPFD